MITNRKKDNFKRISKARLVKIIDMIKLLGNLSNTSFYEFEKDEIETIFYQLRNEISYAESKFNSKIKQKKRYKL